MACSGSDFTSNGLGSGGTNGSAGAGGASSGDGGNAGAAGEASGGAAAGGRGSGGHRTGGAAGATSTGGSQTSGGTANGGGGTTGGGTGGVIVSVDAGPPAITACGKAPPDIAVACAGAFLCTYGTDPRPSCRVSYQCLNQHFTRTTPGCPPLKSCFTDVMPLPVIGKACNPLGDFCTWDTGLTCSCTPCTGTSCSASSTWNCAPAAATPCPTTAPNAGEPCDASGPSDCIYGACGIASRVITHCKNGVWSWELSSCN
jgi:hypothetical protein